jgi:hypothetical protein
MVYQKIVYLIITFRIFIIPKNGMLLSVYIRGRTWLLYHRNFCTQAQIFEPNKVSSVLRFFIILLAIELRTWTPNIVWLKSVEITAKWLVLFLICLYKPICLLL